jgi:lipopolysaccharide transport system ATP-binding protein
MSTPPSVHVEAVSKKFARSFGAAMKYGVRDIAKDLVGIRGRNGRLRPGEFWSLRDVSLEVRPGECLALIGPNGAGKSTLLKLLNGILLPDEGRIEMRGRVGALIEVGAGFHPMLTGRENVYINGAILGMTRAEIDARFDAICAFAGIGEFINSPVKFYSSGMYVRLGFAVAAHTRPDILLVDEILAVGDVAFRMRCFEHLAKMIEGGTTVIVVSHSVSMLTRLSTRAAVIAEGKKVYDGDINEGIAVYHDLLNVNPKNWAQVRKGDAPAPENGEHDPAAPAIDACWTADAAGNRKTDFQTGDDLYLHVRLQSGMPLAEARLVVAVESPQAGNLISVSSPYRNFTFDVAPPQTEVRLRLRKLPLLVGGYKINVSLFGPGIGDFHDRQRPATTFKIVGPPIDTNGYGLCDLVYVDHDWERLA